MTITDIEQYRAFWRKRSKAKLSPEMIPQLEDGRNEAKQLAQTLVEEFGAKQVYLFGSYAWGTELHTASDLDLAVTGLSSEQFIAAYTRLAKLTTYRFDLVQLENLPHHLQGRIRKSGILLHECQSKSFVVGNASG